MPPTLHASNPSSVVSTYLINWDGVPEEKYKYRCKSTLNFTPPAPVDALVAQHPAEVELPEELPLVLVQSLQLQDEVVAGVAEVAVQRRGRPVPVRHPCSWGDCLKMEENIENIEKFSSCNDSGV